MLILITTSWTIKCPNAPDYLKTGEYFEDLINEFFDLEISKHPNYQEEIWVFSITYPCYQAREFGFRIMEYCSMIQDKLKENG